MIIGKKINIIKNKCISILQKFSIYDNRKILRYNVNKLKIDYNYDILISSSDPKSSHLIVKELFKKNPEIAKKWIQYWGDPFSNDINNKSYIPKFLISKEEKKLLSLADKIVYVSPFTLKMQRNKFKSLSSKMFFYPIPFYEKKIYKNCNSKLLGYFGDYYSKDRNIIALYNCCNKKNIDLLLIGNTDVKIMNDNKKITILPRMSKEIIDKYEEDVFLLICVCNKKGTQIPGKIYHYAATNKPILIILDGEYKEEMKEYFESFNRFYICYNNEQSIGKTLDNIFNIKTSFMPLESIDSKVIAKKIIDI